MTYRTYKAHKVYIKKIWSLKQSNFKISILNNMKTTLYYCANEKPKFSPVFILKWLRKIIKTCTDFNFLKSNEEFYWENSDYKFCQSFFSSHTFWGLFYFLCIRTVMVQMTTDLLYFIFILPLIYILNS